MRFAYADPPYYGCGQKLYGAHHPEAAVWDEKQTHLDLIARLSDEFPDGWALSCNPRDLTWLLPGCPDDVRVGAWVKPFAAFKVNVNPAYTWEPLIFRGGRKRTRDDLTVKDHLVQVITLKRGLTGAKPAQFNRWVADLLGYREGDELVDLYPGTGGMGAALAQGVLTFDGGAA
jgi:hypothetical protein